MSDNVLKATQAEDQAGGNSNGVTKPARYDRPALIVYAADSPTETALRDGLAETVGGTVEVRRGGVRAAIVALRRSATPRTLIIDIGGEAQPLSALSELADVLEPDVQVLVVGDRSDLDFYRQITRGLGSSDYLPKPLTRDVVLRHFAPLVSGKNMMAGTKQSARFLSVTAVRGGAGATTIAAYLAWHLAVDRRQHTALLDIDLHRGNAAMLLGVRVTGGLRTAMETPDRVDELFIERSAQILDTSIAANRLSVLASEERLTEPLFYEAGAAAKLISVMQRRYTMIVGDVPLQQEPHMLDFLGLAHRRILVMEPTLVAIRDMLRMLALPLAPMQTQRPIIVLNRVGQPGGLTRQQVEAGLGVVPDIAIPDMPKQLGPAATLGLPQAALRGKFREQIVELAKHAAFERLLDSAGALPDAFNRRQGDQSADARSAGRRQGRGRFRSGSSE
ncbi:AAA family ATPase [Lichenicola sp.]|uniref:AAA family ATPase n=1 Tax=Lichenicola sp. TaxID=2804529 RepID=UPI003B0002BB